MCETWQGWAESLLHFVELTDQCLCCEKLKAVQQHCRGVVGPRFTIANSVSMVRRWVGGDEMYSIMWEG